MLEDVSIQQLAGMLEPHMDKPAWPGLGEPATKRRVKRYLQQWGRWDKLGKRLSEIDQPPRVTWSQWRQFKREGTRPAEERGRRAINDQLSDLTLGLWLGHPAAEVDRMHDLIWALCEMHTWVPAFHEYCNLDLMSTAIARHLAQALWMVGDQLEPEVTDKAHAEIDRRVLSVSCDWRTPDWWTTAPMNWNHVCNANLIITAMYEIGGFNLPNYLHPRIGYLKYGIDGFGDDGSCLEGPGYWTYGFGHFIDAAVAVHHRTGGALNLADAPKIARICRFPIAAHIDGPIRAVFGDGGHGHLSTDLSVKINHLLDVPELIGLCPREKGELRPTSLEAMALHRNRKLPKATRPGDALLPDMGLAKLTVGTGARKTTLAALAGRNDFPHNHNDIGSFILYKHGKCLLTDPGAPFYTKETFGPKRYTLFHCRSFGHSVPVIDGKEQPDGSKYHGTIQVEGLDGPATRPKTVTIEMAKAYRVAGLKQLTRTFELDGGGAVTMTDAYRFNRKPKSIEEAFITYEPTRVAPSGQSVTIGRGKAKLKLEAVDTPGRFKVEDQGDWSLSWHSKTPVQRISFTPKSLSQSMTLRFRMQ